MEILTFLATTITDNGGVCSQTEALKAVIIILKFILNVVRILVPIALIVLGSIDIGKAVIAGDEKKIKEAQKPFVKRIVAAVIVFLIPWIVDIIMSIAGTKEYNDCWSNSNASVSTIQCYLDQDKEPSECQ